MPPAESSRRMSVIAEKLNLWCMGMSAANKTTKYKSYWARRSAGAGMSRSGVRAASILLMFGLAVLIPSASGCKKNARLTVSPVHGRVTYNGQGVPRATVIFQPVEDSSEGAKKLRPFGDTDDQGKFDMKTYVRGDGAPPGKYRVSIIGIGSFSTGGAGKDKPGGEAENAPPVTNMNIPSALAKKYGDANTSGIDVTVREGENNLPPFELK